ncbi:MAG: FAD/NAD(P)-binding protein [Pirellulales bacterium]|nr:FAD/NAD(P)-binding protein [Pirellulales bacterium]
MMKATTAARPEPICGMNTWMPVPARILRVREENFNTRTFTLQFTDEAIRQMYGFLPGQFNMLYVPGVGEAAISISSDSEQHEHLDHTIRIVGSVTRAVAKLPPDSIVGLRGPFGTAWPLKEMEGKDIVIVAGGIGIAPLRPSIYWILNHRSLYKRVVLLYGCRTPEDRVFADELEQWDRDGSIQVLVTVDNATGDWSGPVGVVTNLMRRVKVNADRTVVLVCGPKILNRVAAWNFLQLHVPADHVYVSLERNMNCGFGRCGHCQLGPKFICKDGPVFNFAEIADIFTKEEM